MKDLAPASRPELSGFIWNDAPLHDGQMNAGCATRPGSGSGQSFGPASSVRIKTGQPILKSSAKQVRYASST